MMKQAVTMLFSVGLLGMACSPSKADPVLDVSIDQSGAGELSLIAIGDNPIGVPIAQTFTVWTTGLLTAVEIEIYGASVSNLTVGIASTDSSGGPEVLTTPPPFPMDFTNILASVTVGAVDPVDTLTGEWLSIPFNLPVDSGDVLAVVLSGYTEGGSFPLQPPEVVFWVWAAGTLSLLAIALACLAFSSRRPSLPWGRGVRSGNSANGAGSAALLLSDGVPGHAQSHDRSRRLRVVYTRFQAGHRPEVAAGASCPVGARHASASHSEQCQRHLPGTPWTSTERLLPHSGQSPRA